MFAKFASAAVIAFAVAGSAAAAQSNTVIKFDRVDVNNAADRARALGAIEDAGRDACSVTGTRLQNTRCVKSFVKEAILSIKREDLRVALMKDAGIDAAAHTSTALGE